MEFIQYNHSDQPIEETARSLGLEDKNKRLQARKALEAAGPRAVLILLDALKNGNNYARKEAAMALGTIKQPNTAAALVEALEDEDHDVRWAAGEALIELDQDALEPLVSALRDCFDNVHLREGARHILNCLKDGSCLERPHLEILKALEGLSPATTVPWAAQKAWDELYGPKAKK